jgi:hypothetical protein
MENQFNSPEEKLGFFQISCLSSIIAMAHEGASRGILMEMKEIIESFNSTIWSLLALCSTGKQMPETDKIIQVLGIQLDTTFSDLKSMTMELNELRKNNTLKKSKTNND